MSGLVVTVLAVFAALCLLPWIVMRNALGLVWCGGMVLLCMALPMLGDDPFTLGVSLGPVALYLLVLGAVNLYQRPLAVSGVRDTAALGLAAGGLALIGPMQLFFPTVASIGMGAWVWALLAALYALGIVFLALLFRPRLIIYNITPSELRPVLAEVAGALDENARWAGDSLHLPALGVQLHIESFALLRNVSLVSSGPHQDHLGWRRLELALAAALGRLEVPRNRGAVVLVAAGLILVVFLLSTVSEDPQAVAKSLLELLQS